MVVSNFYSKNATPNTTVTVSAETVRRDALSYEELYLLGLLRVVA